MDSDNIWVVADNPENSNLAKQMQGIFQYTLNRSILISAATGLDLQYVLDNFIEMDKKYEEEKE